MNVTIIFDGSLMRQSGIAVTFDGMCTQHPTKLITLGLLCESYSSDKK